MTGQPPNINGTIGGFLRHQRPTGGEIKHHPLSDTLETVMGRELTCEIILDSQEYGMVSRRHAVVRPVVGAIRESPLQTWWEICDLNSVNGTYINGQRVQGCQTLQVGDRLTLGTNGPEFIFEYQPKAASNPSKTVPITSNSLTFTQLFPLASTGKDLTRKAYLLPGSITVMFVVLMFASLGNSAAFNQLLAAYLGGAGYYFVYQLCGQQKPWWWLLSAATFTVAILLSPVLPLFILIFRQILPGELPDGGQVGFLRLVLGMFFGAGLMEELLKALPVLLCLWLGTKLPSPWNSKLGVLEPLDGILLGCAAAVGFTWLETLGQYVPEIIRSVGELEGLQLLIPRMLGSVAGHMAYSGYFGYFIGLSALKPNKRWLILGVGYLSASLLHALWNSTVVLGYHVLAVVGILSYAFLTAAILKARSLSPVK
ncbi:MAG TPA: PrsW family intramembrane metalloprotease [Oscillatoriaceae cyanobacterium M33_DOE_052]|uniref:PrsW family intramembrane metalloprotease n=1 Tax=Planktothricoides sp. SpSt-374 TaxID=2282167 RepID=A0A7C3VFN0_9CYAN|nr:PrsW family intramembrane metalloprotease [Oscillatoriaceae cyanobacterium M33_DOE_052]